MFKDMKLWFAGVFCCLLIPLIPILPVSAASNYSVTYNSDTGMYDYLVFLPISDFSLSDDYVNDDNISLLSYRTTSSTESENAQLFDYNELSALSCSFSSSEDGYSIKLFTDAENGTDEKPFYSNASCLLDLAGKTVTCSYESLSSNVPDENSTIGFSFSSPDGDKYPKFEYGFKTLTYSFPENARDTRLRIFLVESTSHFVASGSYSVTVTGLMLNEGSKSLPWQPHKNHIPPDTTALDAMSPVMDFTTNLMDAISKNTYMLFALSIVFIGVAISVLQKVKGSLR